MWFLVPARLAYIWRRWLPVVVGLGIATALPVLVAAVGSATAISALRQQLSSLPPGERSVTMSFNGIVEPAELDRLDRLVATALPRLAEPPIRRQMLYRQIVEAPAGRYGAFVLAGTDGLAGAVRLTSGRLPTSCTPARCEVVALGSLVATPPPHLGLIVVGQAQRTDTLLLSGTFDPGAGVPVLLGDGARQVSALAALASFGRSYGWVAPLDADRVRALGLAAWVREGAVVAQDLWRDAEGLVVTAPVDAVREQDRRARLSVQRFGLLGSSMAVLLLGTAVVGGAGVRHDHAAWARVLRLRGARPARIGRLVAVEIVAVVLGGAVLGGIAGGLGAAVVAERAGLPWGETVIAGWRAAWVPDLVLVLAAAVLVALTVRGRTASAAITGVALAAGLGAALLVVRGGVAVSGGGDPLLGLLPALILTAAGLGLARVWPALARATARVVPRRAVAARLGIGAVAGRPLRPAATAALLAAAIAAAAFAASYRATLDRGAADQASFAAPLDVRATGPAGARPQDLLGPSEWAQVADGDAVVPVLRAASRLRVDAEQGATVQLLGLPPAALGRISRWDAVTGGARLGDTELSVAQVSSAIRTSTAAFGTTLPPGRTLRIVTTDPVTVAATAHLRTADGRERSVPLRVAGTATAPSLLGELPTLPTLDSRPPTLSLIAISLREPTDSATLRQHNLGEGNRDRAAVSGRIVFGTVTVDGQAAQQAWQGWTARGGVVATDRFTVDYRLDQGLALLTGPTSGPGSAGAEPLPVMTDALTAAEAVSGRLTLILDGVGLPVRVVAATEQFPTLSGRFAVADGGALARLLDLRNPGTGQAGEVWLDLRPGAAIDSSAPPFDKLVVSSRADIESAARADPVARAASGVLLLVAIAVLLVAAGALVLLIAGERREDAARAYAWEADGVPPSTVRWALWWRAVAVAGPAVPWGIAVGLGLAALTARLVAVTALATTPHPPLIAVTGWAMALALLGGALVLSLGISGVVAGAALREPRPVRSAPQP